MAFVGRCLAGPRRIIIRAEYARSHIVRSGECSEGMYLHDHLGSDPTRLQAMKDCLLQLSQCRPPPTKGPPGAVPRMVALIWAEHRLPDAVWEDLCKRLLSAGSDLAHAIKAIVTWGRVPGHALCIGASDIDSGAMYATFVTSSVFCKWLRKQKEYFSSDTEAYEWLMRAVQDRRVLSQRRTLDGIRLREYTMWATFNPPNGTGDPTAHLPVEAADICACLALSKDYLGEELLTLCYQLPAGVQPHIPTVATVVAGEPWSEYWQPSPHGDTCGRSQPYAENPRAYSCPEVVHEPVEATCLVQPITVVR